LFPVIQRHKGIVNDPFQTLSMELVIVSEQTLVDKSLCLQSVMHGLARGSSLLCTGFNSHYGKMDFIVNAFLHIHLCFIGDKVTKVFRNNEIFDEKRGETVAVPPHIIIE
jgi:hypothetical protein